MLILVVQTMFQSKTSRIHVTESSNIELENTKIQFNKHNLNDVNPEYVLAAIAWHEAGKSDINERRYIMEAVWNRVEDDFNNNGASLEQQMLAPKQFTGLFLYHTHRFSFDYTNITHLENLDAAREIIYQKKRTCPKRIYYWAGKVTDKNTSHWRNIYNESLNIVHFKNIFK